MYKTRGRPTTTHTKGNRLEGRRGAVIVPDDGTPDLDIAYSGVCRDGGIYYERKKREKDRR